MKKIVIAIVVIALPLFAFAGEKIIYGIPSRISSLDPYLTSGIETFTVTGFVIEPLARIQPFTQELKPWLAESWSTDQKSKTIKIKLRKDVKFHNGQALTAEDVKFTWESYSKPEYKGEVWRAMWSDVTDAKVLDPVTVEFRLKELKFQTFQNIMTALRILPKGYYGKLNHQEWNKNLVGSGPFEIMRFDSSLQLTSHPYWWGKSASESLTIKTVPDAKLAEQMLVKNELDVYEIPSGLPPPANSTWIKSPFGRGFSLGFNFRKKELQNLELRKALIQLWNRKSLSEKIFSGRLKPSVDSYSPSTNFYPKGTPQDFNPERAGELIKKLGFTAQKPLTLKVLSGQPGTERWLGMYQADAAKVGVKIEIEKVADEGQWWQLLNQGKFDLVAYDGAFSQFPNSSVWHSNGAYNSSGIKDEKLDQMLDQLDKEFDLNKRHQLQSKLIIYLREKIVEIPGLMSAETPFLLSSDIIIDQSAPLEAWRWRKKVRH